MSLPSMQASGGPIENHLPRVSALHDLEAVAVSRKRQAMRDDRRYVEPALQHRRHLVPGLEHLAAVDALDDEALEDHLVPVDGGVARRNAEQRHAAAVMHGPQQIPESGWVTRHLESDVEALDHSERLHRVVERLPRDVDRA